MNNIKLPIGEGITKDEEIVICDKAIKQFGGNQQLIVAMEEMGELIQAISKVLRGLETNGNFEEEIADVDIMLTQLKILGDLKEIEKWREYKLKRLKERIEKDERLS